MHFHFVLILFSKQMASNNSSSTQGNLSNAIEKCKYIMLCGNHIKPISSLFVRTELLTADAITSLISNKKAVGVPFVFNEMIDSREIAFEEAIIVHEGGLYEMIVEKVFNVLENNEVETANMNWRTARFLIFTALLSDFFSMWNLHKLSRTSLKHDFEKYYRNKYKSERPSLCLSGQYNEDWEYLNELCFPVGDI